MTTSETLLGGRYQLRELLGAGGTAQVHAADDVRLMRSVAVKVLRPDLADDPSFRTRFRREAQAAASLDAPCIVSVYDTGEDERGVPYIVMERVHGLSLRDVLHREGRLVPQRALEVVADVCGALQVAHRAGIAHRDVKPGNVMLAADGEVKVMDFGIARTLADASADSTRTAGILGTAAYLSPEQARGEHVDARSDVYSTGCLLYELLTGAPPFTGDSPVAVAYQHVREAPVVPSAHEASLSPDVDAVVLEALAKDPADRYQSAADMRADLLRAAAGQPVAARPARSGGSVALAVPGPQEPAGRRWLGPAAFGLLLAGVAVGTALLVRAQLAGESSVVVAPGLTGRTQAEATAALAAQGLRVGQVRPEFVERPAGTVVAQDPAERAAVPRGGSVDLVVSKGLRLAVVPELLGSTQQAAAATLRAAGLVVGTVEPRDGGAPAGQVLEVSAPAGRQLRAGKPVDLVVASGRVEVPDVRGLGDEQAVQRLASVGLSVAVQPIATEGEAGEVLEQSDVGDRLEPGEAVRIGVAVPLPRDTAPDD